MGTKTKIAWADSTISPWIGCAKCSPGCDRCYAKTIADRFYKDVTWGTDMTKWRVVKTFSKKARALERKAVRTGRPIFVFPSMCDPFYWDGCFVNDFWRTLASDTPHLVWMLLTKRPERIDNEVWPRNVWLGVTAEDQERADVRVPELLRKMCYTRFVCVEPMLGPVDLFQWLLSDYDKASHEDQLLVPLGGFKHAKIHWVICGGESGAGARRMKIKWAGDLRDQCEFNAHFWFKQWGGSVGTDRR